MTGHLQEAQAPCHMVTVAIFGVWIRVDRPLATSLIGNTEKSPHLQLVPEKKTLGIKQDVAATMSVSTKGKIELSL